jgi:hypothetical protein
MKKEKTCIVPIKRNGRVIHWATLPKCLSYEEAQDLERMFPDAYVETSRHWCPLKHLYLFMKDLSKAKWHPADMPWAKRPILRRVA